MSLTCRPAKSAAAAVSVKTPRAINPRGSMNIATPSNPSTWPVRVRPSTPAAHGRLTGNPWTVMAAVSFAAARSSRIARHSAVESSRRTPPLTTHGVGGGGERGPASRKTLPLLLQNVHPQPRAMKITCSNWISPVAPGTGPVRHTPAGVRWALIERKLAALVSCRAMITPDADISSPTSPTTPSTAYARRTSLRSVAARYARESSSAGSPSSSMACTMPPILQMRRNTGRIWTFRSG